jgi:two-component system sensor histidine kinase DesK
VDASGDVSSGGRAVVAVRGSATTATPGLPVLGDARPDFGTGDLAEASVQPMKQTDDQPHSAAGRASDFALLLSGVWLVFLVEPVYSQWDEHGATLRVIVGTVATLAFATTYLLAVAAHVRLRAAWLMEFPVRVGYAYVGTLLALAGAMWWGLEQRGSGALIFIAVIVALALPTRHALAVIPAIASVELLLSIVLPGWERDFYTPAIATAAGFVMWGAKEIMARNLDLMRVRVENERLVVEQERNRFGRDLHDILGHSLTVITVKTELARRLLDLDVDRARDELADLERLSREALADVRRAVQGYREISLPGEIARARVALSAAGIDHELPNSTDDVPAEHRELFAWTIREGVTNVIRHSDAELCTVRLSADRVSVVDDGRGRNGAAPHGHGLAGLRERAEALGAVVAAANVEPRGFALEVVVR